VRSRREKIAYNPKKQFLASEMPSNDSFKFEDFATTARNKNVWIFNMGNALVARSKGPAKNSSRQRTI
jgi:hypothetical protein